MPSTVMHGSLKSLHCIVVAAFLFAFTWIGTRGLIHPAHPLPRLAGTGPQCCSDTALNLIFRVPDGTAKLNALLEKTTPPDHPLVIFFPDNSPGSTLASQAVCSAIVPRESAYIPVTAATLPNLLDRAANSHAGGIFFCYLTPPGSMPGAIPLFPGLYFIPLTGAPQ